MNAPFDEYLEHGWKLCRIKSGEKGPRYTGWNTVEKALTAEQAKHVASAGLMHAYSGTCALDIDDLDRTRAYFAKHGIDLDALLAAPDAVGISSGTPNRAKLLFALPTPLRTKKVLVGKFGEEGARERVAVITDWLRKSPGIAQRIIDAGLVGHPRLAEVAAELSWSLKARGR